MRTISVRVSFMAAVFGIAGLFQVLHAPLSAAAPNPDSCFTTTGTTSRTITNYNFAGAGCGATVEIPSTIAGGTVVSVGDDSFNSKGITSISIPNSVTNIGSSSFAFNQLSSVNIPNAVTTIGYGAFTFNSLISVTLPSSLTNILDYAFANNDISSIVFPNSITNIGGYAFSGNELTSLVVPSSITIIKNGTFNSNKLVSVTIPNSVNAIGNHAFNNNQLTNVIIPNSVTIIEQRAFSENELTTVTLSNSLTDVEIFAFYSNRLTSVLIPSSLTNIGEYAFSGQSSYGSKLDDSVYSGNSIVAQSAVDSIWYVNLYTTDPNNPRNFNDSISFEMTELDGQNNDYGEAFNIGGYIINPTSAELQFVDGSSNQLLNPILLTGQTQDGSTYFNDYLVKNGPIVPIPYSPYSPTAADLQAARIALSQYYRAGSTLSYTAAAINGATPTPASYSYILGASTASNQRQFVYAAAVTITPPQSTGQLANTGLSLWLIVAAAAAVISTSVGILGKRL